MISGSWFQGWTTREAASFHVARFLVREITSTLSGVDGCGFDRVGRGMEVVSTSTKSCA